MEINMNDAKQEIKFNEMIYYELMLLKLNRRVCDDIH